MFNVFLPKLLESRLGSSSSDNHVSRKRAMWDVVIFTLGGCPGAIVSEFVCMYWLRIFGPLQLIVRFYSWEHG